MQRTWVQNVRAPPESLPHCFLLIQFVECPPPKSSQLGFRLERFSRQLNGVRVPHFGVVSATALSTLEELCCKVDNQVSFEWYHIVSWLYAVEMYPEPLIYNYRFPKHCRSNTGRMNCMKRWRIHGKNIVSSHPMASLMMYFLSCLASQWTIYLFIISTDLTMTVN